MRFFSLLYAFYFILMLSYCYSSLPQPFETYPSTANLSTTWALDYSLRGIVGQLVLVRETSTVGQFSCGFFCEGGCTSYIFAIFISPLMNESRPSLYRVVWSANRDHPVRDNAILNFTAAGELILKDENGNIVWTTNTAGKSVVGMNLTDTGNLVLFDDHNSVVWQSFDHPTDCWLLGQTLFEGQKLKSSVSSTNSSSKGMYSLHVTDKGLVAYIESNPPQAYYRTTFSRLDNYTDRHKGRRYVRFLNGSLSLFTYSFEPSYPDETTDLPAAISPQYNIQRMPKAVSPQYIQLMPNGYLKLFVWQSEPEEWEENLDITTYGYGCNYPLICGRNSICSANRQCGCPRFGYFRPVDDTQPDMGCIEITPLTCHSTQYQDFITLNVSYVTLTADMVRVDMETCKQTCLNNCSCKAVFFQYDSNASSGECFLTSELFTIQAIYSDYYSGYNSLAFIKVQNVTSPSVSHRVARVVGSTIGTFVILLLVAIGVTTYVIHKRKRNAEIEEGYLDQLPGMPNRFSYEELTTATENFSKKVGEGGFGSVFEGNLKDGLKIAVKCLEGLSHIKKSFLAEVQSIGSIHHVNLVRLRGFCTWKSQHFLVYDFMSNGSLDKWIYHGSRKHTLEWKCRQKIILDIAKGLTYLHEDCRQKIVHLDIKPQNILLDKDFNAKVSDFGLSKLIDKNLTEVMSTIKGTPGYIAPEWRSSIITEKLDIYSFGIVLLEILCGRKIFDRSEPEESWHLLFVFQKCWEQETLLDMVDKHSEDMQLHKAEVMEMMKLASWCLQTNYKRRPSMSSVVKVLEGGMNVEPHLDYNFTDLRIQETEVGDEKDVTQLSASILSGPR